MHHTKEANVTTHKLVSLSAELSLTALDADSNLKINIAYAAAAAILSQSPTFHAIMVPSYAINPVPTNAAKADPHVANDMSRPNKSRAKNGTNLTLRYRRNPDR